MYFQDGENCGPEDAYVCIDGLCQQPVVKSIVRLQCAGLPDNPGYNVEFEVPTTTDIAYGEFEFRHGRSGDLMPLDNHIGNSYEAYFQVGPTDQIFLTLSCDQGGMLVGGFTVDTYSDSIVTALGLTCIAGPQ